MISVFVVIADVLFQQPSQMWLVQNDHVVQQVSAHTSNPTLGNAILPGTRKAVRTSSAPFSLTIEMTSVENLASRSKIKNRCACSCPHASRGKTVLLKPHLVDCIPGNAINTNPLLVLTAAESFRRLAKSVLVAGGPGHQRDTQLVLSQSGYEQSLRDERIRFPDLNRDDLIRTRLHASYTGMEDLWLPRTVLEVDFLLSMPKIKTHHWSGVTLSMKNMFGIVGGARHGWPKNILHWNGIRESILDLCATVPIHFVIADGIEAMDRKRATQRRRSSAGDNCAHERWGGCRCNMRTVDGIRTQSNRSGPRGLDVPR
jgi:uncharacterized protein (DUF362 family)